MDGLSEIREQIMEDPANKEFTEKGWVPIFLVNKNARVVIIGQAPGIVTQEKGDVLRDKSGDKLREWMGVSEEEFYQSGMIAVLPMDFYFPGKGKVGDLPPRKDFAPKWHPKLLALMPDVELIILMGRYPQKYYLKKACKKTLTETVFDYKEYLPKYFPIVHSSPLNFIWFGKNPWFEEDVVPVFRKMITTILDK